MWSLGRPERSSLARLKDLDIDDLHDQIDTLRAYVNQLTGSGTSASRQFGRARDYASGAAHDAEDLMKDNLAASLVLALGLGLVVGYFIRRGSE
jgi:hypothetical protein